MVRGGELGHWGGVAAILPAPKAADLATVLDVLKKLDAGFGPMSGAFEKGQFALWVGSGISREAPSLGGIIARALEHLRLKAIDPATQTVFLQPFRTALALGDYDISLAEPYFATPFETWPKAVREDIVSSLWNKYSALLDIRIPGTANDYMLWDAVDVRAAFANPKPPQAAHLCIAILILEGALREIASANWDGFIEAAVVRLGGALDGNVQVVVDPSHLRGTPGKARLIKFHGCIVHATDQPHLYRHFLVGSTQQIGEWPHAQFYAAIRGEVISLATNSRALMTGLSLQDGNLQAAFVAARQANPWPWPITPQAHVFCENAIGPGQRQMLQTVYRDCYNNAMDAIETSALLQAWGEQVLIALVLKTLGGKFHSLMQLAIGNGELAGDLPALNEAFDGLRNYVAELATGDRTSFANRAIALWSRALSLFRNGRLPDDPESYEILTMGSVDSIPNDQNAQAAGLGELGVALALLERGRKDGRWLLTGPIGPDLSGGAFVASGNRPGAEPRSVFFARTAGVAIALEKKGAFANDNTIVIHADDVWKQMKGDDGEVDSPRSRSRAPGRTGATATQHICIGSLLASGNSFARLSDTFVAEFVL